MSDPATGVIEFKEILVKRTLLGYTSQKCGH
jgi:hypothetical protein